MERDRQLAAEAERREGALGDRVVVARLRLGRPERGQGLLRVAITAEPSILGPRTKRTTESAHGPEGPSALAPLAMPTIASETTEAAMTIAPLT